jgi:anti-sigma regulatory factor (Ser/Thr protein kinase)
MPAVPGYDLFGVTRPAEETGGDTFDVTRVGDRVLIVLGDATGHGIGPALSVTQMQAMLRMAFRLGADLEHTFVQANNLLCEAIPADRFITAFIGLLDPANHTVRFQSGGQAPILHYRAATRDFAVFGPTSFPLAAMPLENLPPAVVVTLEPGDLLALISDGVYEYGNESGAQFGDERVRAILAANVDGPMAGLGDRLLAAVEAYGGQTQQEDDMTMVLVKRNSGGKAGSYPRTFEALDRIFEFTAATLGEEGVPAEIRTTVDFALEELFTNIVKYGRTSATEVRIELKAIPGGVEVVIVDPDADPFDVTQDRGVDTTLSLDERTPGGLGIHLVQRMMDAIEYHYSPDRREARITLRKTLAPGKGEG